MLIKYCVFSLNCCAFYELCQFCCSAGFLPSWCVYTHWHQGKTENGQSPEYSKIFGKNTLFNEHPVLQLKHSVDLLWGENISSFSFVLKVARLVLKETWLYWAYNSNISLIWKFECDQFSKLTSRSFLENLIFGIFVAREGRWVLGMIYDWIVGLLSL